MNSNNFISAERAPVRGASPGSARAADCAPVRGASPGSARAADCAPAHNPSRPAAGSRAAMSPAADIRAALRLLLALSAGLAAMHVLGRGQLATPPLQADQLSEWMRTGEPVLRAAAVGRMLALLIGSWAWLSLVAGLVVRAVGWGAGVRLLDRLSPQLVRSVLRTTATAALLGSVSISGPLGLSGAAAATSDASADPSELVATMHWEPEVAAAPTPPGPTTTTPASSTPAPDASPSSSTTSMPPSTSTTQSAVTPTSPGAAGGLGAPQAPGAAGAAGGPQATQVPTTSSSASASSTADAASMASTQSAESPAAPRPTNSGPAGSLPASPPALAVPGSSGPLTHNDQSGASAAQGESAPTATTMSEHALTASWRVERGEHLWGIAASVVAHRTGAEPAVREVADYWLRLIDENRDRFLDPANPDLIHAGLVLTLPT